MLRSINELQSDTIEEYVVQVRGEILVPGDAGYEKTVSTYIATLSKRPGMIVKCVDAADVILSVNFAGENRLSVAIMGGGHNDNLGIAEGGLVIDLSGIKFVWVDNVEKTVRVGGGNVWGEVDHATYPFGLAVPAAGIISTTSVGDLTHGGGVGYLSRKYGLAIDNLLEVDMVLADGEFVTVNARTKADLFWAIRGGGNFGIVTSYKFQAYPVKNVYGGPTLWPVEKTNEIMEWYHRFIHTAPAELNGFITTLAIPGPPFPASLHNRQFCGIVWCYAGDLDRATELFQPILAKRPLFSKIGRMTYPSVQCLFDDMLPPDPANANKIMNSSKNYWDALHSYSSGGAYLNFMINEGQEQIRSSFKNNYDRLKKIKKEYDPYNFFAVNQHFLPNGIN
jgi:FAD/FMN-containing dehydrogenase